MPNRPVHFEIHAQKPIRCAGFYSAVFGWQFIKWDGPMPYWIIDTGEGEGIDGGLMERRGPAPEEGQPVNSWVMTIDVESVDDILAAISLHGGTVAVEKVAIPGVGWLAYAKDTEGNLFGVMQEDAEAE